MTRQLTVTGTALRNADGGSRARIIQRYCWIGCPVVFQRQHHEPNAIAVYLVVPGFLFGKRLKRIGNADPTAVVWLEYMLDHDRPIHASVTSSWIPNQNAPPRVTVNYEAARQPDSAMPEQLHP